MVGPEHDEADRCGHAHHDGDDREALPHPLRDDAVDGSVVVRVHHHACLVTPIRRVVERPLATYRRLKPNGAPKRRRSVRSADSERPRQASEGSEDPLMSFDVDRFVEECRETRNDSESPLAVKEVLERAMSAPDAVADASPQTEPRSFDSTSCRTSQCSRWCGDRRCRSVRTTT